MNEDDIFGFHVGDIVKVADKKSRNDIYSEICLGKTGVVVGKGNSRNYTGFITVDFEGSVAPFESGMHRCYDDNGKNPAVKNGCGQWIPPYDLELVEPATNPFSINIDDIL